MAIKTLNKNLYGPITFDKSSDLKGKITPESGYVYAPYIPLQVTEINIGIGVTEPSFPFKVGDYVLTYDGNYGIVLGHTKILKANWHGTKDLYQPPAFEVQVFGEKGTRRMRPHNIKKIDNFLGQE